MVTVLLTGTRRATMTTATIAVADMLDMPMRNIDAKVAAQIWTSSLTGNTEISAVATKPPTTKTAAEAETINLTPRAGMSDGQ